MSGTTEEQKQIRLSLFSIKAIGGIIHRKKSGRYLVTKGKFTLVSLICYSPKRYKNMLEGKLWWFGSLPVRLGSMINFLWFVRLTLES